MIYAKYEFDEVPIVLEELQNADVVIVGKLVKIEGSYDIDGNVITEPIISDKIAVDVLYHSEVLEELDPYRVYPNNHRHFIGGQEYLYYLTIK